tara:strand:- start:122271 stop:122495 length:225 start_codon:yes stop_codon:yes gene_type:complete
MPLVFGHDMAGVVTEVGKDVLRFSVGDAVNARPSDDCIGTFAQSICVPSDDLAFAPKTITIAEAASLPLVSLTA